MKLWTKVIFSVLLLILCILFATESHAISQKRVQKIEAAVPTKATSVPIQPRKLLVFNLCEGYKHSSIPYWDKALEVMGRKTGAYEAVLSQDMSMFKPENLKQFDAVCFNNTTELEFEEPLRKSLMNFIKGGKGIVGIHGATDNFYDWPEAAEMFGGQFCGHPWTADGTWAVKIDEPENPLMAVFEGKRFKINDEIYRTKPPLYSRDRQLVLMSLDLTDEATANAEGIEPTDVDIGISWVKTVGKGRLFYCSLGHNHHITWNATILQHYLDGIQFALGDLSVDTTPSAQNQSVLRSPAKDELDELLGKIATYEYGQSRKALSELTDLIIDVCDSPEELKRIEKRLAEFLQSDATLAGKFQICRKLAQIGTDESVPVLAEMLINEETSDMARYALESILGSTADQALRQALKTTRGKIKIGVINSLGRRQDEDAVEDLKDLINDSDTTTAVAVVAALGQISTPQAAQALEQELDTTNTNLKPRILDSYLKCADQFVYEGQKKQALEIYKQLYVEDTPTPMRIAALRGMVAATPKKPSEIIFDIIKSGDEQMQTAAIGLLREMSAIQELREIAAELPNLSAAQQAQLLSVLADRGDRAALPVQVVVSATKSTEESVRIAALKAIGKLGGASHVGLLAQTAATTKGAEQQAARESLYYLRGSEVDQTILGSISRAEPKVKVELIRSVGQRNVEAGVETLLKTAKDTERNVRVESLKALRDIADLQHVPALVDLLISAKSDTEVREAERAVVSASQNAVSESADVVLASLSSVKDVKTRCSLLGVLGKIGGSKSLDVLREALEDDNSEVQAAAIRGLSDWPTAEPVDDLLKVAEISGNRRHKALAFRGFVRMIGLESDRSQKEAVKMYEKAMALASNASEKKMVLSGLARTESFAALEMAAAYLEDEALQQEAAAAIVRIAYAIGESHPEQTRMLLRKVIKISKSDSLRELREWAQEMINEIE